MRVLRPYSITMAGIWVLLLMKEVEGSLCGLSYIVLIEY